MWGSTPASASLVTQVMAAVTKLLVPKIWKIHINLGSTLQTSFHLNGFHTQCETFSSLMSTRVVSLDGLQLGWIINKIIKNAIKIFTTMCRQYNTWNVWAMFTLSIFFSYFNYGYLRESYLEKQVSNPSSFQQFWYFPPVFSW